jgi:hypothetical protein
LHDVVCRGVRANERAGDAAKRVVVPCHQSLEGLLVAAAQAFE